MARVLDSMAAARRAAAIRASMRSVTEKERAWHSTR
jgi:hypothetical protein